LAKQSNISAIAAGREGTIFNSTYLDAPILLVTRLSRLSMAFTYTLLDYLNVPGSPRSPTTKYGKKQCYNHHQWNTSYSWQFIPGMIWTQWMSWIRLLLATLGMTTMVLVHPTTGLAHILLLPMIQFTTEQYQKTKLSKVFSDANNSHYLCVDIIEWVCAPHYENYNLLPNQDPKT
jgi:hypothetical protein